MLVIGLMSGTSLDGVDAALVDITESEGAVRMELIELVSVPYSEELVGRLKRVLPPHAGTVAELARLHYYLADRYAEVVKHALHVSGIPPQRIGIIGCHGQTVCNVLPGDDEFAVHARLQIGDASVIAVRTGIPTIGDFRPAEVAAGGEGAPLISYFDYHAFRAQDRNRIVLNMGGIANITYIPKGASLEDVRGFDTGPGNMLLDRLVQMISEGESLYDVDGRLASQGEANVALLNELLRHPFVVKRPPKSAGREEFGAEFAQSLLRKADDLEISDVDLLATCATFTVQAVVQNCEKFAGPVDEVIVGGGGAHNRLLMRLLEELYSPVPVVSTDQYGVPTKAREAMGIALLAYQAFHRRANNVPGVTGARHPVIMGKLSWGAQ